MFTTKRRQTGYTAAIAALGALLLMGSPAEADIINLPLTSPNTAISPFPAPYGNVEVNLTTSTTATITFTGATTGGFTYLFIDSSIADVNVNASSWTIGNFSFTTAQSVYPSGGFASTTGPSDGGDGTVDGFGKLNQTTTNPDGTDQALTEVDFTLTNTSGTWASASNVLTPNSQGAEAAAHVVVFAANNVVNGNQLATGFVANGGSVNVPEPASLAIFGAALAGLGLLGRRRRHLAV